MITKMDVLYEKIAFLTLYTHMAKLMNIEINWDDYVFMEGFEAFPISLMDAMRIQHALETLRRMK